MRASAPLVEALEAELRAPRANFLCLPAATRAPRRPAEEALEAAKVVRAEAAV